jgi:hypothetical protein
MEESMDLRAPYLFLYRTISFEGMEVDMEVRIWRRIWRVFTFTDSIPLLSDMELGMERPYSTVNRPLL